MPGPAGMKITETVSGVERPRLTARTRTIGTRRLLVAVRGQQLEPAGEGGSRNHNTDRRTGVLAGRVSVCFRGYTCRGLMEVGDAVKSCAEARHRSADP